MADLSWFDIGHYDDAQIEREREMLDRAIAGDEASAAELLLRYVEGKLRDIEAKKVIALSRCQVMKLIAVHALKAKGEPGRPLPVSPLMLFRGLDAKGSRGPKTKNGNKKLSMLVATRTWLTRDDLKQAVTDRPAKIHRLETRLAEYVQGRFPGSSQARARVYVRRSFPGIPWSNRDDDVEGYDELLCKG